MARLLVWFSMIWGVALVIIGASHVVLGMDSVLGAGAVSATVDSEHRFAGALVIGYGTAYLWAVRRPVFPGTLLRFLAVITAIGAVGRLLSMAERGSPYWFYVFGTVVEFAMVAVTLRLGTLGARTAAAVGRALGHAHDTGTAA